MLVSFFDKVLVAIQNKDLFLTQMKKTQESKEIELK